MSDKSFQEGVVCIIMDDKDNVATLLRDVVEGEIISYKLRQQEYSVQVKQEIKSGHKVAIEKIKQEAHIIKYGESIGRATKLIDVGEHVHIHNLEGIRGRGDNKKN